MAPATLGALTVEAFCDAYGLRKTKFYAEVGAGRLEIRKSGRKSLVLRDEAERWAHALPRVGGEAK